MTIEITGTNTWNKGAELMLVSILEHFKSGPDKKEIQFAVTPAFGTFNERAKYGLFIKPEIKGFGKTKLALNFIPPAFKKKIGLVNENDISVILDASGFAFGDQHPNARIIAFAEKVEKAKKHGKKVILLPQALGPFEKKEQQSSFQRIVQSTDLIFARDPISFKHATSVNAQSDHIKLAPDFTNMVKSELGVQTDESLNVCIVPNQRMIEKAKSPEMGKAYIQFIVHCIKQTQEEGFSPFLLIHGRPDYALAEEILTVLDEKIQVVQEDDPITIKKIIGESHFLVASRFHALIGALSQNVPAIGTSWSHKYEMLFEDYNCKEMLIQDLESKNLVETAIKACIKDKRKDLKDRITQNNAIQQKRTQEMWKLVDNTIFSS